MDYDTKHCCRQQHGWRRRWRRRRHRRRRPQMCNTWLSRRRPKMCWTNATNLDRNRIRIRFFGSAGSYRKKIVRDISCPMSQSTFHHNHLSLDWSCNIRVGQSTKGKLLKFMDDVTMSVASQKVQGSILWRITSQCYNTSYRRIKCSTFLKDCSELFRSAGPSATV